jgi:hypothetical protein
MAKPKPTQQALDAGSTTMPPDAPSVDAVQHGAMKVRASVPRRYRGGIAFGIEPVIIPAGTLTAEQLEAIVNDPCLGIVDASPGKDAAPET